MCIYNSDLKRMLTNISCVAFCYRPHDTPFEDGTFKLTIEFTEEYPNKPPSVRFISKMFHPNGKSLQYLLWHAAVVSVFDMQNVE